MWGAGQAMQGDSTNNTGTKHTKNEIQGDGTDVGAWRDSIDIRIKLGRQT